MKGDSGDGIPNFLSGDDCFISGTRQKPVRQKSLDQWVKHSNPEDFCDQNMLRGYKRNEALVDLSKIPSEVYKNILAQYNEQEGKKKADLLNYFIKFKLKNLMEHIGEF
jgi:hypothetical protein